MGTKRIGLSPNANHKTGQLNTYKRSRLFAISDEKPKKNKH